MKEQENTSDYLWQALRLFNLYRVILALGFLTITYLNVEINFFGAFDEDLFQKASVTYLSISVLLLLTSLFFKQYYSWQANGPIFIDIVAIVVIMHASGGLISGVGILLIVIVAAHSLLVPGKLSSFSAAIATIGIFIEHGYSQFSHVSSPHMYTQAGLLGAAILTTSFVTSILSLRARKSQIIVENQAHQLAASQQLNAHIVSAMHAGVLVLDNQQHVRLLNSAAKKLLELQHSAPVKELKDLPLFVQQSFQEWQQLGKTHQQPVMFQDVRLTFHPLGKALPAGTLIFIYDVVEETRHAQDLKLTSLGHLTANIAHELRNPLGAASHAAQLLAESSYSDEDRYLVNLIKQSCDRMNIVIQNVLSLSGRKPAKILSISLVPWLEQFINDLVIPHIAEPKVSLQYDQKNIIVDIDPSQLTQILINLCENGLRYSLRKSNQATLTLRVQTSDYPEAVYLDVIDQGEGINPEVAKHLFEPFFTTENAGSGLGLYIARELSQINGARLDYYPSSEGCQFRITIPLPEVQSWHNQQHL